MDPQIGASSGGDDDTDKVLVKTRSESSSSDTPTVEEKPFLDKRTCPDDLKVADLEIKEDYFPREHHVDPRDTLDKVAAQYHTTPTRLAQYNKLTSRFIFAGQVSEKYLS
jgi:LysM repeat protein